MSKPLVTVVCLCYNQSEFVKEAVDSVLRQTYNAIQLIIVDDASTDSSVERIQQILSSHPSVESVFLEKNMGNCAAFNRALLLARGEFIVDFAADDVMTPHRIERQVDLFSTLDESYGVVFSDAVYIDEEGKYLRNHYDYLFRKGLLSVIPEGDVYRHVLSAYCIASPTMLIRKKVMDALRGYDENLSYEDFDFWVRSSRMYKYAFQDEKLTMIRKRKRSMSTELYKRGDKQLHSTYLVCKKAMALNRDGDDVRALAKRLKYELRQSVFSQNYDEAVLFYDLLRQTGYDTGVDKMLFFINKFRLPLSYVRRWYHQLRFGGFAT